MTTTDTEGPRSETTTGQIILDAEQTQEWRNNRERWQYRDTSFMQPVKPCPSLTLSFDVDPQPERQKVGWLWNKSLYDGNEHLLYTDILRSWWHANHNTGEPRAGQRVELWTQVDWTMKLAVKEYGGVLERLAGTTTNTPDNPERLPMPLATATLATVPRVEQVKPDTEHLGTHWNKMNDEGRLGRFVIRVEITP